MIQIMHHNMGSQVTRGYIPVWWNAILYVYNSATVLQAARLHPVVETSVCDHNTETSWKHALDILKKLQKFGSTAQRSVVALEILADKVTEAMGPRGKNETDPSAAASLPTPTPSTWRNPSTGPTPAPMAAALDAGDPEGSGIQFPGLGDPFDLAEFDFDLSDMSWLASTPVEL